MASAATGRGWNPNRPVSSDERTVPGVTNQVQVDRLTLEAVQPAGLVSGVQRGRNKPGRDEHEHEACEAEEPREVQPDAAAVDPVADRDREHDPEQCSRAGRSRIRRGVEGGEEEDRGLEPLAVTAKNAIRTSATTEPCASAFDARPSRTRRRPRAFRRIHTIMNVTAATATAPMTVSSASCCRWGRLRLTSSSATPRRRRSPRRGRCRPTSSGAHRGGPPGAETQR